ncbi:MAG TPA: aminotransferase class I/II-fold pyridoxal phosphate-dependent enzyme [Candidatus Thermoplasmatota archaeon]|nr:aminotransferase class I/II-fold pyridoxal phosphate-dependent enzyme [Candidatus Thermoplasmatota archaeon]
MDFREFPLLDWIGAHAARAKNAAIATSGVVEFPLEALPFDLKKVDLHVPNLDGDLRLVEQLCRIYGAEPDRMLETIGASEANFLAMAALADRGDRVVLETPTYGSLPSIAASLGLKVVPLERDFHMGFAVDLEALKRAARKGTKLVVLTNLHNPSGVAVPKATLRGALEIANDAGAILYVDEIFRDFGEGVPSVAELGGRAIATASMSKLYGLGWTRIGWMVTPDRKTAGRLRRARRLVAGAGSTFGGAVAAWALHEQAKFVARAKTIVAENYTALEQWAEATPGVNLVRPDGGPICFPQVRLPKGKTAKDLALALLKEKAVLTTPGELFGRPGHFRIGCGGDPARTGEALAALQAALSPSGSGKARPRRRR